jgi:hypothetical protein
MARGVRHEVFKGVENRGRSHALLAATREMVVRLFKGWLPAGRKGVGHGGP